MRGFVWVLNAEGGRVVGSRPKPSPLENAEDPEGILFKRLDSLEPREAVTLKPGTLLIAVYGDNVSGIPCHSPSQFSIPFVFVPC